MKTFELRIDMGTRGVEHSIDIAIKLEEIAARLRFGSNVIGPIFDTNGERVGTVDFTHSAVIDLEEQTSRVRVVEQSKLMIDSVAIDTDLLQQRLDDFSNTDLVAAISLVDATSRALHNERSKYKRQQA